MNKLIKFSALVLILAVSVSSCKKDDNSNSNSAQIASLTAAVQQGLWKVTYYYSNNTDETNHYTGYDFQFNSNGSVTAVKAGSSLSGAWSDRMDDSTLKLVLNFGTTNSFQELNNDWHVIQQTSAIIKLQDVSGGGGGTEYLTFEKK